MDDAKKQYYHDMVARGRGTFFMKDGHLVGVLTYFVGDNDNKYMLFHKPWKLIEDDPEGTTLYIDQFWTDKDNPTSRYIHREFTKLLTELKKQFPNIKRAKWVRVGAQFRKNGKIEGVTHGRAIHNKNLTF